MTNAVKRALRAGAGLVGPMLLVAVMAGCGAGSGGNDAGDDGAGASVAEPTIQVSEAVIRITPQDGATGVPPDGRITVEVDHGRLTEVRAGRAAGTPLAGTLDTDGHRWRTSGRLALSTQYEIDAIAVDGKGRRAARHAVITTLVPQHTVIGFYSPEAGATVGIGMIPSIRFTRPVTDRAAVERAITVRTDPPVEVEPHWFGTMRLDLRPRSYWRPGTTVTLRLRLRDVEAAPDVYGTQSKNVRFQIGRGQISTVDAAAHTLTVRRGGRVLRTLPISAGSPDHATYRGTMVVSEKYPLTRMNGDTVGFGGEYDIKDVPHAMRLTRSGTFVHGNYWSPPTVFGSSNVSHGCVGLRDAKGGSAASPAGWLFDHTLVGDIVEVVNSHDRTVDPDNGMGGWNLSWSAW